MISYGFFDSVNGDRRYSAEDFTNFLGNLVSDGVIANSSASLQVQKYEGRTVKITAGWAYIQGHYVHNDTDLYLTLDEPDVLRDRVDRIVVRLDKMERKIDITIHKGGEHFVDKAGIPPLQRDENIWELSLAMVYISPDFTEIRQQDITDERAYSDVCGWVTGLIQQIDTSNLFAQYDAAFWTWFSNIKRNYDNQYICNGIDDNVQLPLFLENFRNEHPNINFLRIIGIFGIDDSAQDTGSYMSNVSLWIDNSQQEKITLDFAECDTIHHTKSTTFAFFQNCIIKNLRVAVDAEIGYDANFYVSCIHAENCDFENCHISGKITGDVFMSYRGIYFDDMNSNSQIVNCSINLTAEKSIYGIHSTNEHYFRGCQIQVFGEKSTGFYGNGTLTECQISAMAEENGYGIHAKSSFFATNCEFLGYTKSGQNFDGCGIFGDSSVKIYLNGIKSIAKPPALYSCTNSMKLGKNSTGFYTGIFEPLVNVPDTVYTPQAKNGG